MSNKTATYISPVLVNANKENGDVVTIETEYLSPEGDTFQLNMNVLQPSALITTSSIAELKPEVSDVFPYKIVTPTISGSTLILSPSIETSPTASQNYYVAIKFERYQPSILRAIDRTFRELETPATVDIESLPGE